MADLQPHRTGRIWIDLVVAAAAVLISCASLYVALKASKTQEKLLAASVWPYLQFETSDFPGAPIIFSLRNAGVGPARLRWATLYYNGKAVATAQSAFRLCCAAKRRLFAVTSSLQGRVLTADQTIVFIGVPKRTADPHVWQRLDVERQAFYVRACYCSVLGDCWLFDARQQEPRPLGDCPPAERPVYRG